MINDRASHTCFLVNTAPHEVFEVRVTEVDFYLSENELVLSEGILRHICLAFPAAQISLKINCGACTSLTEHPLDEGIVYGCA